jgi:hypothetical protein
MSIDNFDKSIESKCFIIHEMEDELTLSHLKLVKSKMNNTDICLVFHLSNHILIFRGIFSQIILK